MNSSSTEGQSVREFLTKVATHSFEIDEADRKIISIRQLVFSAQHHFSRFVLPQKRLARAVESHDKNAQFFERESMTVILYEILDTVYSAFSQLDIDGFNICLAADGKGIAGEQAPLLIEIMHMIEKQCAQVLSLEKKHHLQLDFATALDEKEGITYHEHRHWQDFVPGSVEMSFYGYFAELQKKVIRRLNQRPRICNGESFRQTLFHHGFKSLLQVLRKLESQALHAQVTQKSEDDSIISTISQPAGIHYQSVAPRHTN